MATLAAIVTAFEARRTQNPMTGWQTESPGDGVEVCRRCGANYSLAGYLCDACQQITASIAPASATCSRSHGDTPATPK